MHVKLIKQYLGQTQIVVSDTHRIVRRFLRNYSECSTMIETDGSEFVAWRVDNTTCADSVVKSISLPLNVVSLRKALQDLNYIGEPTSLILHPPCVCLKSFQSVAGPPDKWLASHLVEIAPPGNRRELVMCYRVWHMNHLLVAFVRRSLLSELCDLVQQSRISVKGIYVGGSVGVNSLIQRVDAQLKQITDFALCSYETTFDADNIEVFPRLCKCLKSSSSQDTSFLPSDRSTSQSHVPSPPTVSVPPTTGKGTIDFLPQVGFPGIISSRVMRRVVQSEFVLILILIGTIVLHRAFQNVIGSQSSDTDFQIIKSRLAELRHENELVDREVALAVNLQRPRYNACRFLKSVALATPPQIWLTSISYSAPASGTNGTFGVTGISLARDEPLRFADSLRNNRDVRSANVTKASIVEFLMGGREHKATTDRVTKFEITGEYARE